MATQDLKARILVVEDDPHIQLLLRHLLRQRFELELAVTVDEALNMASRHAYDLFLIDINLGAGLTGVDLLGLLRQMPAYVTTPAVACTAYAGPQYREHFLANGFNKYVDKPFSRPVLLGAIEEALGNGRLWGHA